MCACLVFNSPYELVEWRSVAILVQGAKTLFGTQGDASDAQRVMFLALIGAIIAHTIIVQLSLRRIHDQQLLMAD